MIADTCDLAWQMIRDDLIIAAFVSSVLCFLGAICISVIVFRKKCRQSKVMEVSTIVYCNLQADRSYWIYRGYSRCMSGICIVCACNSWS